MRRNFISIMTLAGIVGFAFTANAVNQLKGDNLNMKIRFASDARVQLIDELNFGVVNITDITPSDHVVSINPNGGTTEIGKQITPPSLGRLRITDPSGAALNFNQVYINGEAIEKITPFDMVYVDGGGTCGEVTDISYKQQVVSTGIADVWFGGSISLKTDLTDSSDCTGTVSVTFEY